MRSARRLLAAAALVAVSCSAVACGGDDDGDRDAGTTTPTGTATAKPPTTPAPGATAPATTAPKTTATVPPGVASAEPADPGAAAGGADRRAIERVVRRSLTTTDARASCATISSRLKRRIFRTQARCERLAEDDEDEDEEIDTVTFTGVTVDGDKGVARVRASGGGATGVGRISVLRERGRWLVHGYEADFLRSSFVNFLAAGKETRELVTAGVRSCFEKKLADRSDAEVQRLFYGVIGERKGAERMLSGDLIACAAANPGAVRKQFEANLRKNLPAPIARCLITTLRTRLPNELLIRSFREGASERGNRAAARRIQTTIRRVAQECARSADNTTPG